MSEGGDRSRRTIGDLAADLGSDDARIRDAAKQELAGPVRQALDRIALEVPGASAVWPYIRSIIENSEAFMRLAERRGIDPEMDLADAFAQLSHDQLRDTLYLNTRKRSGAKKPRRARRLPSQHELLEEFESLERSSASPLSDLYERYPDVDASTIRQKLRRARKSRA